jgi:hypothetical protein
MNDEKLQGLQVLKSFDNSLKKTFKNDKSPLHIIAIGDVGCDILEFTYDSGIEAKYTAVSDTERNYKDYAIEFIHFEPPKKELIIDNVCISIYNDMNNRLQMPDAIYKRLESNEKFIIISGLDGYTGAFFTEDIANYLSKKNKLFLIISSYLFKGSKVFKDSENTRKKLGSFENFIEPNLDEYKKMGFKTCFQKISELFLDIVNHYKET